MTDFAKRCSGIVNKRILEAFAKTGVLDSLEPNRAAIFLNADAILSYGAKSRDGANMLSLFANTVEDDVRFVHIILSTDRHGIAHFLFFDKIFP